MGFICEQPYRFDQLRMHLIDDWVGVVGKIYRKRMETVALPTIINWLGVPADMRMQGDMT